MMSAWYMLEQSCQQFDTKFMERFFNGRKASIHRKFVARMPDGRSAHEWKSKIALKIKR